jgi:hypothetical protein
MNIQQKNYPYILMLAFSRSLTLLMALVFVFGGFVPVSNASGAINSYIVKLYNEEDLNSLSTLGREVEKKFTFSPSEQFNNIYSFNSALSLEQLRQRLGNKAAYVQLNRPFSASEITVTQISVNDPGFTTSPQDIDRQWGIPKVGFDVVWHQSVGSPTNVVAVIDTGIDGTHEDLQNMKMVSGYNFIAHQPLEGQINSDDNGHGTLIAGLLGASANNGKGIVGLNWQVSIMPLKALDASGKGDSSTISESLVWAVDHGANFINLSLGGIGFGHDTMLADSVTYAYNKGAVIVAAAGNDTAITGGNLDIEPVYPICDDNNANMIIGVAATDQNDLKPQFSNFGKNCIDVTAPGKRILSTISYDPLSKTPSPNSYAYASGTSLAVPFVVAEATILKSLFPNATNEQIRDRIISSTDPVDYLNPTQCAGSSCKGLLGSGRINVVKAAATEIVTTPPIKEGELVKSQDSSTVYLISGGQKRIVSPFVFNQRFLNTPVKTVGDSQIQELPQGPYATPLEGTLVKLDGQTTVYIISTGLKLPVTYQVFKQRGLDFSKVSTLSFSEVESWATGNLLPPAEGTLVRGIKNKTVYWVVGSVLHPINYEFFIQRGLNVFPIMIVPDLDIPSFPKGEAYIG